MNGNEKSVMKISPNADKYALILTQNIFKYNKVGLADKYLLFYFYEHINSNPSIMLQYVLIIKINSHYLLWYL